MQIRIDQVRGLKDKLEELERRVEKLEKRGKGKIKK